MISIIHLISISHTRTSKHSAFSVHTPYIAWIYFPRDAKKKKINCSLSCIKTSIGLETNLVVWVNIDFHRKTLANTNKTVMQFTKIGHITRFGVAESWIKLWSYPYKIWTHWWVYHAFHFVWMHFYQLKNLHKSKWQQNQYVHHLNRVIVQMCLYDFIYFYCLIVFLTEIFPFL